ncbi:MAG: hypothetical protein ACTS6H_01515 [Candidatus Hodgkinia cicadicola]
MDSLPTESLTLQTKYGTYRPSAVRCDRRSLLVVIIESDNRAEGLRHRDYNFMNSKLNEGWARG